MSLVLRLERFCRKAGVDRPREAKIWRSVRICVDSWSCRPFMIPRGERGTGSEHPSQLGTERRATGFRMSSMTGRSCLLLTSSSRIAFGVGLRVDVSICGDVRTSFV